MLRLRPYKKCDAQYIVSWITLEGVIQGVKKTLLLTLMVKAEKNILRKSGACHEY